MKVLLVAVNAKYIHSNLAIYDLKAYVNSLPVSVQLGEYTVNQLPEDILRGIYEEGADVVAFSCYIWNITTVLSLAEELHKIAPATRIWLGGPEASYDAEALLEKSSSVELVVVGEGEATFYDLLDKHLLAGQDLSDIDGIVYRNGKREICRNPLRPYLNMDEIPFVYEDMSGFEHKILYYETSRGCPFRCSYCLSSIDKQVRFRSLSLVLPELQYFLEQKVPQVKFVDRTFNCNHEHAYEIWRYICDHDNGITNFHFEISADLLKEEDFQLFARMRPGLIQLEIGVQSTNPDTIAAIQRKMNVTKVREQVLRVHDMGNIHQHLDLIAGLPHETFSIFARSFNDVYEMKPDQLQLGFLKVLKGSCMEEHREEYGIVATSQPPYEVLSTKWLTYEERCVLKDVEEMVEVYYNSGQFRRSIACLQKGFADAFTFYRKLADYYRKCGLMEQKHTRLFRYDALRQFALEEEDSLEKVSLPVLEECLLYDLYLTENCKKRPSWAQGEKEGKERLKQLRSPQWRREHLEPAEQEAVNRILINRTDLHLEYFPNTMDGRYVLFDYSRRHPLTNEAATLPLEINSGREGVAIFRELT